MVGKMSFDSVPRPMLLGVMAARKPTIVECATKAGFHGVLKVHVSVAADGHVRDLNLDTWRDRDLGTCVNKALATARFPATTDGGSFDYPLLF